MKGTTTSEKRKYLWNIKRERGKEEEASSFKSTYKPKLIDFQMSKLPTKEDFQYKVN